jgi:hypothetical protein
MMPSDKPASDPDFELLSGDAADAWNSAKIVPVARRVQEQARMARVVRGLLILMATGFAVVLGLAFALNPYDAEGQPRSMATHTQLGLPPCNMVTLIGKPCPACGMTTSFALLMKGDLVNSARANWVGMLLAAFCLFGVPWAIASAIRGRYYFIGSMETTSTIVVIVLLVLMFSRWAVVLLTT